MNSLPFAFPKTISDWLNFINASIIQVVEYCFPKGPFPLHSQFAKRMRFANSESQEPANSIHISNLFARISVFNLASEICLLLIARAEVEKVSEPGNVFPEIFWMEISAESFTENF